MSIVANQSCAHFFIGYLDLFETGSPFGSDLPGFIWSLTSLGKGRKYFVLVVWSICSNGDDCKSTLQPSLVHFKEYRNLGD